MRRIWTPALAAVLLLLLAGCTGGGYRSYTPHDRHDYDEFLEPQRGGAWRWVRGRAIGEVDGAEPAEHIVLATYQSGPRAEPDPIAQAHLLLLQETDTDLDLAWKRIVHEQNAPGGNPFPTRVHLETEAPLAYRHCGAQVRSLDASERNLVLVSLWTDEETPPLRVCHIGYRLDEEGRVLEEIFRAVALQDRPVLETTDLDGDGRSEILLENDVLAGEDLPERVAAERPRWITVYRMDHDGRFREADYVCERCYGELELPWLRNYVHALHGDLPDDTAALYEYYLGLVSLFRGEAELSAEFFETALALDESGRLRERVDRALAEARSVAAEGRVEAPRP